MKTLIIVLVIWLSPKVISGYPQETIPNMNLERYQVVPVSVGKQKIELRKINPSPDAVSKIPDDHRDDVKKSNTLVFPPAINYVTINGQSYKGTIEGILMTAYATRLHITTDNSKIPENHVTCLALGDREYLWIGTYSSGIVIGTGTDIKPFKSHPLKTHDLNIFSIVNENGCMKVTYRDGGYECFSNEVSYGYHASK